jgi:6-phosphofructokinase 1
MKRVAILTSGGDAPGMNAAVRAATLIGAQAGVEVFGIMRGYEGLLAREWRSLTRRVRDRLAPEHDIENAAHLGGSLLGSARCKAFYEAEGRARAAEAFRGSFDGLVVIGGNGSLTGARALATEHGIAVVGIPASIDNDIGCTSSAIGVDTALNTIVEACDRISDTARAHRRAFIVEVMGRQSGYLCMASAIAAGADAALFREDGRSAADIVRAVSDVVARGFESDRGKDRVLVIKAEGVEIPCTRLAREVEEALKPSLGDVEIRATVLGHVVRGGNPSFLDRMIAGRFALGAMNALLNGKTSVMTAWQTASAGGEATQDRSVALFTLDRVLEETAALLDGTSLVTKHRVALMQKAAGVLSL